MNTMIIVTTAESAAPVIRWGARIAQVAGHSLMVLSCFFDKPPSPISPLDAKPEWHAEPLVRHARAALDELDAPIVEHFILSSPNPAPAIIEAITQHQIEFLCVGTDVERPEKSPAQKLGRHLLRFAPCSKLLLDPGDADGTGYRRILMPLAAQQDTFMLGAAAELADKLDCEIVPLEVGSYFGKDSQMIAQRNLESRLAEAGLSPSGNLKPMVSLGGRVWPAIIQKSQHSDLVLIGSNSQRVLQKIRSEEKKQTESGTTRACVGLFQPRREILDQYDMLNRFFNWLPTLKAAERLSLFERLQEGARWNVDFILMIGLSTAIASLGLIQNSTAVVIGAMVVAPLMTPLIGSGLALVQGNLKFFRDALRTMCLGALVCLLISTLIGLVTPMEELTPELLARGGPTLLDLGVAYLSGVAAAYAMARPSLLGALAGVAIATALVPPLATVGIALTEARWDISEGAAILFITNLTAIILGAATIYRGIGIQGTRLGVGMPLWGRRTVMALVLLALILTAPLWNELTSQLREGQTRTPTLPVSQAVREAIIKRVHLDYGVNFVQARRVGVESDLDIAIYLSSAGPVSINLVTDLKKMVNELIKEDVNVGVFVFQEAPIRKAISSE